MIARVQIDCPCCGGIFPVLADGFLFCDTCGRPVVEYYIDSRELEVKTEQIIVPWGEEENETSTA